MVKPRWTMNTKQKYGDEGWSEAGKKFYGVLLSAVKGVNFGTSEWQELWEVFWAEERKVHIKKGEDGHGRKAATEEVDVGTLWDEEEMEHMDDNDSGNGELDSFKITKISEA